MEKLIVRNFGPIKEGEIELNKYVVFIGDNFYGEKYFSEVDFYF